MTVLGSVAGAVGEHFTDGQLKSQDFQKVANAWVKQCISYEQGLELLQKGQEQIQDFRTPLKEWEPDVSKEGKLVLRHKPSLQEFIPTEHCIGLMSIVGQTCKTHIMEMIGYGEAIDADIARQTLKRTLFNPERGIDQDKIRLIRTWKDGTMRAILSDKYAIVNNVWVLELIKKLIPGGVLSHWRGDADTMLGNVLIPDSIREFGADKFGAMLSVGNSEIGARRIYTMPSAFRAICMNGCIWHQERGKAVNRRHIAKGGNINLGDLEGEIAENLQNAIPLTNDIIQAMIGVREFKFEPQNAIPVIAELFSTFDIHKNNAVKYLEALNQERDCGTANDNLFYLVQGVTRMSQTLHPDEWVELDRLAGEIVQITAAKWETIKSRALKLDKKEIAKSLGDSIANAS